MEVLKIKIQRYEENSKGTINVRNAYIPRTVSILHFFEVLKKIGISYDLNIVSRISLQLRDVQWMIGKIKSKKYEKKKIARIRRM